MNATKIEIVNVTPPFGAPPPEEIKIISNHDYLRADRPPESLFDWLLRTPCWPVLAKSLPIEDGQYHPAFGQPRSPELEYAGVDQPVEYGLPIIIAIKAGHHFDVKRQSWSDLILTIALNEDGTRAAIIDSKVRDGADEAADMHAEAIAYTEGGGLIDL